MYLNFWIPTIINFPFGTNGKLVIVGVPLSRLWEDQEVGTRQCLIPG